MKKYILFILLVFAPLDLYAADVNWAADAGSALTKSGNCTEVGTAANVFDEDEATSYNNTGIFAPGVGGSCTSWAKSEFAGSHSINRIKAVFGVGGSASQTYSIEYYDGSWHSAGSGSGTGEKQTVDLTGLSLSGVSAVRITCVASCFNPFSPCACGEYEYELYAYGPLGKKNFGIIY